MKKKKSFVSVRINRVVHVFRKISNNFLWLKLHTKLLLKIQLTYPIFEDMQDNMEEVLELLHKLLGELQQPLFKKDSPSCKNNWSEFV